MFLSVTNQQVVVFSSMLRVEEVELKEKGWRNDVDRAVCFSRCDQVDECRI